MPNATNQPFDPYAYAATKGPAPAAPAPFDPYAYAGSVAANPGDFDPLAAKAAQASTPRSNGFDALAERAAGRMPGEPFAQWQDRIKAMGPWQRGYQREQSFLNDYSPNRFMEGAVGHAIGSGLGAVGGGLKGLWDLASGKGLDTAAADVGNVERESENWWSEKAGTQSGAAHAGAEAESSDWNPLNWIGVATSKSGQFLGNTAERLGAPPSVSTALRVAPAAGVAMLGLKAAGIKPGEPYVPEVERVIPESAASGESESMPADSPPVEGGLPKKTQGIRREILDRVGVADKRRSALEGNAKAAATDYQATRFDEPAGRLMSAQFEHERDALTGFTQRLITKVDGSIGTDEDALINRGTTIAKPFDDLRDWFDAQQKRLYADAQERSDELAANGNPGAYTQLESVDKLLRSPDFRNTLMARDQGNLLNAIQAQLQRFRDTNPNGFTPAGAEQFRQWLNQVWSHENRWAVGKAKDAVDQDVSQTAGEDLYSQARAIRALKARTLENPKGIASLFDADPLTPINRVTPFERIPDKIMALPSEQFANLLQTLKDMPPELQPAAQTALGEIRGQLLNRLLKAGTETRSGRGAQVWKGEDVSQTLGRHAAKFRIAFEGDPEVQAAIKDLNAAGQILRVDQSYPGAYAQAANMTKRGIGSSVVRSLGRAGGAAVGGTLGPLGAAAGEMAGSAAGEGAASALAERSALKAMRARIDMAEKP